MQRRANDCCRIYAKELPQSRARVAAAKAVGAEREVAAALGQEGAHALGHGAHVVRGTWGQIPINYSSSRWAAAGRMGCKPTAMT